MGKEVKTPTKQGEFAYEVGNKKPPKNRQFGQPEGNPRHNGSWKKEDTPRYKLERMITLSSEELQAICDNPEAPAFEQAMASIIIQAKTDTDGDGTPRPASMRFQAIEKMINQVYGQPAQTTVNLNSDMDEKEKSGFIKGVFIPKGEGNE